MELEEAKKLLKAMKRIGYKKELGISRADFDESKKQLEEQIERLTFNKTDGYKKIENYVKNLARYPKFFEFLKVARKKFKIPEKGFKYSTVKMDKREEIKRIWNEEGFRKYVEDFCGEHKKLPGMEEFIASYILFNDTEPVAEEIGISIVKVVDISLLSGKKADALALEAEKNLPPKAKGKLNANEIARIGKFGQLMSYSETYPIAILLNPYMSQRNIIDAVKKLYETHIEPLQKELRSKKIVLDKIRKKSSRVEERNKFIYENRLGKSRKELARLVNDKFGEVLDYTYINKIIRDEREKNK